MPTSNIDNMTLSVDYMGVGPNAPAPVLDRLLRRAIRGPDSMYRKLDIFPEAWEEAAEGGLLRPWAKGSQMLLLTMKVRVA